MLKRLERGDTIVEVLIVLAILGMALGISYATANRSLLGARQAQEHTEALDLVQGQIEQLRDYVHANPTTNIYKSGQHANGFCVSGGNIVDLTASDLTDLQGNGTYPDECVNGFYHLSIKNLYDNHDTFTFVAQWYDVRGSGEDTISMNYRLHQ